MTLQTSQLESLEPTPVESDESSTKAVAGLSPSRLALRRFRRDRLSMVAFVVVASYVVLALLAPILVKIGFIDPFKFHQNLLDANLGGIPKGKFGGVSGSHLLGVEPGTGRDVLARMWYGVTFSLTIALAATLVSSVLGVVLGIIAGFRGGLIDATIGRVIDLTLSFPQTLMLLALSTVFVLAIQNALNVNVNLANGIYEVLVLGLFGWPTVARLIRGQVLSIREREFIDAAVLLGASQRRIYFKEILPNLWAPILVSFTLTMPAYVSTEAALSFLNVGIKPPTPTLGNILDGSINYAQSDFLFFFFPALLIAIIVVSFNLLGDGIRDALDPKSDR
ncbi:ABC transporter permease [Nocardioides mangrovicus]|uniref:ABC transporter permease n=1 Tax=Nocardioides mangrovicus TaxID=2478913 RepID=A0A3L8P5D1_9ACTN|nr:ABC transporter permease [Nocardioides mangrovicus]RLV50252.1 ABC transporter permease [Nocardioides mangrovicus]